MVSPHEDSINSNLEAILIKLQKLDKIDVILAIAKDTNDILKRISPAQQSISEEPSENIFPMINEVVLASKISSVSNTSNVDIEVNNLKEQVSIIQNQSDQNRLTNDVSAFGIPSTYEKRPSDLIVALNKGLGLQLTNSSFKFINFINKKKLPTCNLQMRFTDNYTKSEFMAAAIALSRDVSGRRSPLTIAHIFEEFRNPHPLSPKEIFFTNSLSPLNRQIIKLKSKVKPSVNFMWEQGGRILMKHNSSTMIIQAQSPQHVLEFASKTPNQLTNISKSHSLTAHFR